MICPYDAWTLARLMADLPVNGELDDVSDALRPLAERLAALPAGDRRGAFDSHPEAEDLIAAVAAVDPLGPAPMDEDDDDPPVVDGWPEPPEAVVLHGLAGEFVRLVGPHSEADPVAVLVQLLAAFGVLVGRTAHVTAEADRHYPNLFAVLVGRTAKGRKGSSWGWVRRLMGLVDPDWAGSRIMGGLSSGEGLIYHVRDPVEKDEPIREAKSKLITGYQKLMVDGGVEDKRLLTIEPEFASVLKNASREGNNLSATIRMAWDTGDLRSMVKNSPNRATGAHVGIIGHITRDENRRHLTATEMANGLANRFLWLCVRRSQRLPFGGTLRDADLVPLAARFRAAAEAARGRGRLRFDDEAAALWVAAYPSLSEGRPGLLGAVLGRAEAQVLRLSLLYALLDSSAAIGAGHLRAALGLWRYAERSAAYIFDESLGDADADALLAALRAAPRGLTRTAISRDVFAGNKTKDQIRGLLAVLLEYGLAYAVRDEAEGPGRRAERWFAGSPPTKETEETN